MFQWIGFGFDMNCGCRLVSALLMNVVPSIGSNFLLTDGHTKYFRGPAVSGGSVALAQDCNQGAANSLRPSAPSS